jgi:hypothetical protein
MPTDESTGTDFVCLQTFHKIIKDCLKHEPWFKRLPDSQNNSELIWRCYLFP